MSKKREKEDGPVEPLFWVLPNKKEFPNWINKTFIKYKSNGIPLVPVNKTKFKAFKYQNFLRDYMQEMSPYRGVLLYHGLGSGKTCTSINISENLKTDRNVIVLLPASLKNNFIEDGLKFCGEKKYKLVEETIYQKYSFISYNASNTVDQMKKISSFDNHTIIIEEVHNLVSMMVSSIRGQSKQGEYIYKTLMEAKNLKIVALSGTPIINQPFEIAILFNILRGYIETAIYNIGYVPPKYGNNWKIDEIIEELEKNTYIDYIEVNRMNKTLEVHYTVKSYDYRYEEAQDYLIETCQKYGMKIYFNRINKNTLFPETEEEFNKFFIDDKDEKAMVLINEELFKRRILGLVSFYASKDGSLPEVKKNELVEVYMSNYQYGEYEKVRLIEKKMEKPMSKSKKDKEKKKGPSSLMRIFSRQLSNFVFPEDIPRPFIQNLLKYSKSKSNIEEQNEKMNKELKKAEQLQEKSTVKDKEIIKSTLNKLSLNGEKYLKQGESKLKKYSPKMSAMLDIIDKTKGTSFVYSDFRTLEGVEIFSRVLEANGYSSYINDKLSDKPKFALYTGSEKDEERKEVLKVFNGSDNKYGDKIKVLLVTRAGAEGLDLKNIRNVLIMEPYWNMVRINQVIGRAVRRNSHIDLPEKERNVSIYRFIAKFTPEQIKTSQLKEKQSTDQYILEIAERKQNLINKILEVMKVMAVDCTLNKMDNKGDFKCFSFPNETGLAYVPEIGRNLVHTYSNIPTKEVEKKIITGALTKDNTVVIVDKKSKKYFKIKDTNKKEPFNKKPKLVKKIGINKNKNIVYNYNAVKEGNLIKLGKIDKNSKMI